MKRLTEDVGVKCVTVAGQVCLGWKPRRDPVELHYERCDKGVVMEEVIAKLGSMSDVWEKLIVLLLGWLLGLLGPAIVDSIRRKRENQLGRVAILNELRDVGRLLVVAAHGVRTKEGKVDREHLQWMKSSLERRDQNKEDADWIERLDKFLEWSDEEIVSRFAYMAMSEGKLTMLQKYPVPLLDSRVAALWSFDTNFQRRLLDIKQRMHRLDDMVERQRKMHDMTFSNLEPQNRHALRENIQQNAAFYAENARKVADLIETLTRE